jgi:protein tyrosine/serine phosphatase
MISWDPETDQVLEFIKIIKNPDNQPVFVHCQHGSDRTGLMCAMYRILVQDWTKDEAIMEMVLGGYGFHPLWRSLIEYIQEVDVEEIKFKMAI